MALLRTVEACRPAIPLWERSPGRDIGRSPIIGFAESRLGSRSHKEGGNRFFKILGTQGHLTRRAPDAPPSDHQVPAADLLVLPQLLHPPFEPDLPLLQDVGAVAHLGGELTFCSQTRTVTPTFLSFRVCSANMLTTRGESPSPARPGARAWVGHQAPAHGEHLLLSSAQSPALASVEPLEEGEERVHLLHRPPVRTPPSGDDFQILSYGKLGEDPAVVGHVPDAQPGDPKRGQARDFSIQEPHAPGARRREPHHAPDRRGLAGAVPAQERDNLPSSTASEIPNRMWLVP